MKPIITLVCSLLMGINIFAQNLQIEWQNCFGSPGYDTPFYLDFYNNEIYIIGGVNEQGWNVSNYHGGGADMWLIKLNRNGELVFEKTFGGSLSDGGRSVSVNEDYTYLSGFARSNDGDIENNPYPDSDNFWVLKLDRDYNIIWEKMYGGSMFEDVYRMIETKDGGMAIVGITVSTDGDISHNNGGYDGWIIKIDANGNKLWELCIGDIYVDVLKTVIETPEEELVVGGPINIITALSDDCQPHNDSHEALLAKIDKNGQIIWQKCIGGSNIDAINDIILLDDGFLISGYTDSSDGDLLGSGTYAYSDDFLVAKLDKDGDIIWINTYGGSEIDVAKKAFQTIDGGFIIFGLTSSFNGDVSENPSADAGIPSLWVVKIDADGHLLWEQCFGGRQRDDLYWGVEQIAYNRYIVAAEIMFDSGDIKCTEDGDISYDWWVFELLDTTVGLEDDINLIKQFSVKPNPANSLASIEIPQSTTQTSIYISNTKGQIIETLTARPGQTIIHWDCSNNTTGVYFYNSIIDNFEYRGKIVVM